MIAAALPQLVWGSILKGIWSLAQQLGGPIVKQKIDQFLGQRSLEGAVKSAVQRAYDNFTRDLNDPELLTALAGKGFQENQKVAAALAAAATAPQYQSDQVRIVADEMRHQAKQVSRDRCEAAARLLIDYVHGEIAGIQELQTGLLWLGNQQLIDALAEQLPLPPYQQGLREAIEEAAEQVATELEQGYIVSAHLLYALLTLPNPSSARRILEAHDATADKLKAALKKRIKPFDGLVVNPLTKRANDALHDAQVAARQRRERQTRSEHVLFALLTQAVREPQGAVAVILNDLGISARRIHSSMLPQVQAISAFNTFSSFTGATFADEDVDGNRGAHANVNRNGR